MHSNEGRTMRSKLGAIYYTNYIHANKPRVQYTAKKPFFSVWLENQTVFMNERVDKTTCSEEHGRELGFQREGNNARTGAVAVGSLAR